MKKIFVDGQEGTTGLVINDRLKNRTDIEILKIDTNKRKDVSERKKLINEADIVFLCLPDDASREAVAFVENENTRIIDASTAFRTHPDWAYGIPELSPNQRELIKNSKRVSVPGCHASGFTTAIYPLVHKGIVPTSYPLSCFSLTGYSGGGKKLIEQYENTHNREDFFKCARIYGLSLSHKHLSEMQIINNLEHPPVFTPVLSDFYKGMIVGIPVRSDFIYKYTTSPGSNFSQTGINLTAKDIHSILSDYYENEIFIKVMPFADDSSLNFGCLDPLGCNDTNRLEIFVTGHDEQILIMSRLDNLGKGASGAAVQCMNIMMGADEDLGLVK